MTEQLTRTCRIIGVALVLIVAGAASVCSQTVSLLDIEDGAGTPGEQNKFLSIRLTNAMGLREFAFTISSYPNLIESPSVIAGGDTQTNWTITSQMNGEALEVSGKCALGKWLTTNDAEIALFRFAVSASAPSGATAALLIDDAIGSFGYDIRADVGQLAIGASVPQESRRTIEFEFEPEAASPGDSVLLKVWADDVPKLSGLQVDFDMPDGGLILDGNLGGVLLEQYDWPSFFAGYSPMKERLLLLADSGSTTPLPMGRLLLATIPFRVSEQLDSADFPLVASVRAVELTGDLYAPEVPRYYALVIEASLFAKGATATATPTPTQTPTPTVTLTPTPTIDPARLDFDNNGTIGFEDLVLFSRQWKKEQTNQ